MLIFLQQVEKGDIVASQISSDGSWYRARVVEVIIDDYDDSKVEVEIDYVDFGDNEKKPLASICELPDQYLKLNFQAIACCMANLKPAK